MNALCVPPIDTKGTNSHQMYFYIILPSNQSHRYWNGLIESAREPRVVLSRPWWQYPARQCVSVTKVTYKNITWSNTFSHRGQRVPKCQATFKPPAAPSGPKQGLKMEATFKKVSRSSSDIVKTLLFLARHLRVSNWPWLSFQLLYSFRPEALSLISSEHVHNSSCHWCKLS